LQYSLLIRNGLVVEGTGSPWFRADIGIVANRIVKISRLTDASAKQVIDASGRVVCPGFIDSHSHSDIAILINPRAESKVRQGVTTEVIGNCGSSAAPLNNLVREQLEEETPALKQARVRLDWSTMVEYLKRLKSRGIAVNIVALVGHGNIRAMVLGFDRRDPTRKELRRMSQITARAIQDGAVGLSTGLIYPPGSYTKTKEIIELAKVVSRLGGIYTSHIRGEGETLLQAVKEAITIGERAGIPVQISHHKAGGRSNWGKVKRTLPMIEQARKSGVDVTCDVYPYVASSFSLSAMLPPWAHEGGSASAIARLKDPVTRRKIRQDMMTGVAGWMSPLKAAGWGKTVIASCPLHRGYQGLAISQAAKKTKRDPFTFAFDLLIQENFAPSVVRFAIKEDDVRTVLSYSNTMIGSDGRCLAPYGPLGQGKPHPRNYGTFPRIIAQYVRETRLLRLEEAIRRMTSLPAQRFKLQGRGIVKVGMYADLCVFDPSKIQDTATFSRPHQYPKGITHVIVNGQVVVKNGEHTGRLPGRPLTPNPKESRTRFV
jgi:N-acyl-D-amino-acid deacylase